MREQTAKSWGCLVESDGSRRGGIDRTQWYQLAIYGMKAPGQRYLVSIRFFSHPSKEPFQAVKECRDPVAVAAFLITHDPMVILKHCRAMAVSKQEMQRVYQVQVNGLLLAFEKECRSMACRS
jgi:hypothetical protein